ncbi:hypothetical protein TcYC6_0010150 [Trypanosoma cruzi]|nr:hypothetical protein TcYC6_0010150 [Trypanosoma cruzi]
MRRFLRSAGPPPQLLVLFLFSTTYCINILNWIFYIRYLRDEVEEGVIAAYIAFSVIGCILFFLLASPLIYWTYARASEIPQKNRRNVLCIGIGLCFFFHEFPLGWIEIYLVWYHGWRSILSSISLFIVWLCFTIGFFSTWLGYTWYLSKRLHFYYTARPDLMPVLRYMVPSEV